MEFIIMSKEITSRLHSSTNNQIQPQHPWLQICTIIDTDLPLNHGRAVFLGFVLANRILMAGPSCFGWGEAMLRYAPCDGDVDYDGGGKASCASTWLRTVGGDELNVMVALSRLGRSGSAGSSPEAPPAATPAPP